MICWYPACEKRPVYPMACPATKTLKPGTTPGDQQNGDASLIFFGIPDETGDMQLAGYNLNNYTFMSLLTFLTPLHQTVN
ncbi:MAG TPA: hypothetical protein DHU56_13645 [Marinobacter sp.]|nr:hypothetical protein [Marinobacter sp.]